MASILMTELIRWDDDKPANNDNNLHSFSFRLVIQFEWRANIDNRRVIDFHFFFIKRKNCRHI